MARTHLITGAASGIGLATRTLLEGRGDRVIGVDLHDADIVADLGTAEGRAALVTEATRISGGRIDAIHAVAGLAHPVAATVAINFFGTVATLDGLRPLRFTRAARGRRGEHGEHPAVGRHPRRSAHGGRRSGSHGVRRGPGAGPRDDRPAHLLLDEEGAGAVGPAQRPPEWAGAGIPLNAVAHRHHRHPDGRRLRRDAGGAREAILQMVPMP